MKRALLFSHTGSIHSRFNKACLNALRELGYELHLMANFENGSGPEGRNSTFVKWCKSEGLFVHHIDYKRGGFIKNIMMTGKLKSFLKKWNFDIVHAHTETGGLLLRLASSVKRNSKFVYTAHGMSFWKGCPLKNDLIFKNIEHWICCGMDMNLGMNAEELEVLKSWTPTSYAHVHGIGLDVSRMQNPIRSREEVRNEFGLMVEDKFILSIGELDDNKNHITVIRALAKLKRKDFKYVVCGVGYNKDKLLNEANRLGIKENIVLAGYRSDIPDILNAADIFVFPSFHEGMPVSALEAMACGLPIICSEIRGNVDIIKEGDNGYLFPPANVDILSQKIAILMDNPQKREAMGAKNREIVKEYSLEAVTEELKRIYQF